MLRYTIPMLAALALTTTTSAASDKVALQVGVLECELSDETNFVVVTQSTYDCTFKNNDGSAASFTGNIDKVGVDLSYNTAQVFNWLVLSPALIDNAKALEGRYGGVSTDFAVLGGAGLRVLIGGSDEQIALQPFSTSGHEGFGAAVGIESFKLSAR